MNLAIKNILESLRAGDLTQVYNCKEYLNDIALNLYNIPNLNDNQLEDLKDIISICNITYNDTDKELLPIEDGFYDLLLEKYKTYDPHFQVGAEIIDFKSSKGNGIHNIKQMKDAIYFNEPVSEKDYFFLNDIVINTNNFIDNRDFEIKNIPLSEEYITKRLHNTSNNHPELVGTLDKAKFVLDKDAISRGVFNDTNVKTVERDFFVNHINKNIINSKQRFDIILELKYDGISVEADCTDEIVSARSRGDTGVGAASDLTPFLKGYKFPHRKPGSEMIGVKFEAIITQYDLPYFNAAKGYEYKNCRSAIVGLLSSSDAYKYRDFITLVPLAVEERIYREVCHSDRMEEIKFLNDNFISKGCPLRHTMVSGNYIENLAWINIFTQNAESLRSFVPFMYDGIVVSYRDESIRNKLGRANNINKWSIAVKFNPLRKETIFRGYSYTIGQDGSITPMIHYDPVEFYGTIHTKSTGHSLARFNELELHKGDMLMVEYVNDVMPYVSKPISDWNLDNEKVTPLEQFPEVCPVCGSPIIITSSGKSAKCTNPNCDGRQLARMVNMFNKLQMDGFGEATVIQLGYYHLADLLIDMTSPNRLNILEQKGFGPVECQNIVNQIDKLLQTSINDSTILGAIGFTSLASKTWELILPHIRYHQLKEMINSNQDIKDIISSIKGIGPATADTISREFSFFERDIDTFIQLGHVVEFIPTSGKKIRFTGFRDKEFANYLCTLGFDADGDASLTNDTDILLVPNAEFSSTKTQKAMKNGITIVPVNEFRDNVEKYL